MNIEWQNVYAANQTRTQTCDSWDIVYLLIHSASFTVCQVIQSITREIRAEIYRESYTHTHTLLNSIITMGRTELNPSIPHALREKDVFALLRIPP